MNNRTVLTGFAVVVLAGLVALIVALRGGSDSAAGGDGREGVAARGQDDRTTGPRTGADRPALPTHDGRAAAEPDDLGADPAEPTIYVTDGGVLVRDHRRDRSKPPNLDNLPPRLDAPRKMESSAIMAVRGALRTVVRGCEKQSVIDATGDSPRVQVVVTVTVVDEQLTVDAVDPQVADVADGAPLAACIRKGFAAASMNVKGQPDVRRFRLTHPFRLRR